jgi:hypothetical protein
MKLLGTKGIDKTTNHKTCLVYEIIVLVYEVLGTRDGYQGLGHGLGMMIFIVIIKIILHISPHKKCLAKYFNKNMATNKSYWRQKKHN